MGCDIHPCIEIQNDNGEWEHHDSKTEWWEKMDHDPSLTYDTIHARRPNYLNILSDRNYTLFAVLADVRNYGSVPITPLFANRDLPGDISDETEKDIGEEDQDLHSHTYFTVQELLDTDWDAVACRDEIALYADEYIQWKETGKVPDDVLDADVAAASWARNTEKQREFNREVTEGEMTMLLMANEPKKLIKFSKSRWRKDGQIKSGPYVTTMADRTYRQIVPDLVECIPELVALGPPDKVRILIAFDN